MATGHGHDGPLLSSAAEEDLVRSIDATNCFADASGAAQGDIKAVGAGALADGARDTAARREVNEEQSVDGAASGPEVRPVADETRLQEVFVDSQGAPHKDTQDEKAEELGALPDADAFVADSLHEETNATRSCNSLSASQGEERKQAHSLEDPSDLRDNEVAAAPSAQTAHLTDHDPNVQNEAVPGLLVTAKQGTSKPSAANESPNAQRQGLVRSRGRPPNINENSLVRRLQCLLDVQAQTMTMKEACERYSISARTFYRWLSDKDRLIELTGWDGKGFPQSLNQSNTMAQSDVEKALEESMAETQTGTKNDTSNAAVCAVPCDLSGTVVRKRPANNALAGALDFAEKRRLPPARGRTCPNVQLARGFALQPGWTDTGCCLPKQPACPAGEGSFGGDRGGVLQKTRVGINSGGRRVSMAWYPGATSQEIQHAIARRFALDSQHYWTLIDDDGDEIVLSSTIPSGEYRLSLLSGEHEAEIEDAVKRFGAPATDASASMPAGKNTVAEEEDDSHDPP